MNAIGRIRWKDHFAGCYLKGGERLGKFFIIAGRGTFRKRGIIILGGGPVFYISVTPRVFWTYRYI